MRSVEGTQPSSALRKVVLPDCVPPATTMFSPATTAASRKSAAWAGQHAEPDEVADRARPHDEPPHVDRPVLAGDVGDDDVQPAAVGQHRVDERAAEVEAPPGHAQHALDEVADLRVVHDDRGQLAAAVACDEHATRGVDPDLLDRGIVEEPLQRAESGDGVEHRRAHGRGVVDRAVAQGLLHRRVDQPADGIRVAQRVDAARTDLVAHPPLDQRPRVHARDRTFATRVVATVDPRPVDDGSSVDGVLDRTRYAAQIVVLIVSAMRAFRKASRLPSSRQHRPPTPARRRHEPCRRPPSSSSATRTTTSRRTESCAGSSRTRTAWTGCWTAPSPSSAPWRRRMPRSSPPRSSWRPTTAPWPAPSASSTR